LPADPRATCIIGVARRTWHTSHAPEGAPEPLAMWEQVAREAAADTGAADVLPGLDSIDIVYSQSWQYDDAVARLADRLGASPTPRRYSGIGGSGPHVLATEAAREIRGGGLDLALITGAEALATVRRLKKAGERPQWSFRLRRSGPSRWTWSSIPPRSATPSSRPT
jgi:acetyl-CoA C-acetyltransferase